MFRKFGIRQNLFGKLQSIFVLLLFIAFLHVEMFRLVYICSLMKIRLIQKQMITTSHQYSFEESIFFWR